MRPSSDEKITCSLWLTLETKVDNFACTGEGRLRGNDQETRMGRKETKSERIVRQVTSLFPALPFLPPTTLSFLDLDENLGPGEN